MPAHPLVQHVRVREYTPAFAHRASVLESAGERKTGEINPIRKAGAVTIPGAGTVTKGKRTQAHISDAQLSADPAAAGSPADGGADDGADSVAAALLTLAANAELSDEEAVAQFLGLRKRLLTATTQESLRTAVSESRASVAKGTRVANLRAFAKSLCR